MGADLLLAMLVIDKEKEPDYEAGKTFLRTLPIEDIDNAYQSRHGDMRDPAIQDQGWEGDDFHFVTEDGEYTEAGREELRKYAIGLIDRLRDEVISPEYSRGMNLFEVRGAHVYLSGGMSWGDMPTEEADLIYEVGEYPGLLEAMGFEA